MYKDEIVIRRLISRSEKLAKNEKLLGQDRENHSWRLKSYTDMIQNCVDNLQEKTQNLELQVPISDIVEYQRKVDYFKKIVYIKSVAIDRDDRNKTGVNATVSSVEPRARRGDEKGIEIRNKRAVKDLLRKQLFGDASNSNQVNSQTIDMVAPKSNRSQSQVGGFENGVEFTGGSSFFETDENESSQNSLKHRSNRKSNGNGNAAGDEYEHVIDREKEDQNNLVQEMLEITRQFKESATDTKSIIENDIETLNDMMSMAGANLDNLDAVNNKLKKHNEVYSSCWMQLCILLVTVIFFAMVMLIKIIPQPRS